MIRKSAISPERASQLGAQVAEAENQIQAVDIKKGDKIILLGAARTVTHVRKSRQYAGFYTVQFANDPLPSGAFAADLKWNEAVTKAVP